MSAYVLNALNELEKDIKCDACRFSEINAILTYKAINDLTPILNISQIC